MTTKAAARYAVLGCLMLVLVAPPGALAQVPLPPPPYSAGPPGPPTFGAEELDQLLAPIALYPDDLLAQILMAATYPLEVVEAARWVQANPGVQGPRLEAVMQQLPWDPSVKSLTAFPQVLAMLSAHLDWTQRLGDAFLAQEQDVMATVQILRAKAQAAGYLRSTSQEIVIVGPQGIQIESATPQVVYVPIYDPRVVYGSWWYPAYPPYLWYPPGTVLRAPGLVFGLGVAVGAALWGTFDWGHHRIHINVNTFNVFNRTTRTTATWQHDPAHRKGVPYYAARVRQQFGQGPRPGVTAREVYRGRAEGPAPLPPETVQRRPGGGAGAETGPRPQGGPGPQVSPAPRQVAPHVAAAPPRTQAKPLAPQAPRQPVALEGLGRGGEARTASDRGRLSRQSMAETHPAPTVPAARPTPGVSKSAPSAPNRPGKGAGPGGENRPHP
jgi:hypothetical protein